MKRSQNTKSNSIKNIRERLGGSQQWWADYLSISRSLVKMVEAGLRTLPTAALLKLSAIELLPPTATPTATKNKKAAASKSNPLAAQARKLELQLHRAQLLLETTQQRYTQATQAAIVAAQLLQQAGKSEEGKKDKLLLEAMQLEAEQNKTKYGPTAQAYLQWKIDCYTYGIQRSKELANE